MRLWLVPTFLVMVGLFGYPTILPTTKEVHAQGIVKADPTPVPVVSLSPTITFAQNPVTVDVGDFIELVAKTDCTRLKWEAVPIPYVDAFGQIKQGPKLKALPARLVPDPKCVIVSSSKVGTYKLRVYGSLPDGTLSDPVTLTIRMIDPDNPIPPGPTPPIPPGPTPPIPPSPTPTPSPAPIPDAGFRVLIRFDKDRSKLSPEQNVILESDSIRNYLDSKCVVGADGKQKEWRIYPDPVLGIEDETILWQNAMKRPRGALPSILISDGKTGFEGALPTTIDETLKLLKKYGGE